MEGCVTVSRQARGGKEPAGWYRRLRRAGREPGRYTGRVAVEVLVGVVGRIRRAGKGGEAKSQMHREQARSYGWIPSAVGSSRSASLGASR